MIEMAKLVIFDFWGTLVENGVYPSPVRQVKYMLAVRLPFNEYIERFENVFMLQPYDDLYSAFKAVCREFEITPRQFMLDNLVGMWNTHKLMAKPFSETMEVLEQLKAEGCKIAMISNTDCFTTEDVMKKYGLDKYFDEVMLSCKAGMLKNDTRMFETVLNNLGVSRNEAVMVGDSIETDMEGAKNAGIRFVLLDRKDRREFSPKIRTLSELNAFLHKK